MERVTIDRGAVVLLQDLPDFSIAIDGYVSGPQVDLKHHRFSFDHHEDVIDIVQHQRRSKHGVRVLLGLKCRSTNFL